MNIHVYAILKDYFDKEFTVDETVVTIAELSDILTRRNPAAKTVLSNCRFAVNNNFVDSWFRLQPGDKIHIIPPSSGG